MRRTDFGLYLHASRSDRPRRKRNRLERDRGRTLRLVYRPQLVPCLFLRSLVAAGLLAIWLPGLVACDRPEPRSPPGARTPKYAELADADANFEQKKYAEAIVGYRTFYRA